MQEQRGPVRDIEAIMPDERAAAAGPSRRRTLIGSSVALLSSLLSGGYLLNPTMGVIELIPDNLPIVGNLDEAGATVLLMWALGYLLKGPGRGPLALTRPSDGGPVQPGS